MSQLDVDFSGSDSDGDEPHFSQSQNMTDTAADNDWVDDFLASAWQEAEGARFPLPATRLAEAPNTWLSGDDMSIRTSNSLRIGTINIAAVATQLSWEAHLPRSLADLMSRLKIDILCMQEIRLYAPDPGCLSPLAARFSLEHNLQFLFEADLRARTTAGRKPSQPRAGVAFLFPASWPSPLRYNSAVRNDLPGRQLALIFPHVAEHNIAHLGVCGVYGFSGGTGASRSQQLTRLIKLQAAEVLAIDAWFVDNSCKSAVICGDFNLIAEHGLDYVIHPGAAGTSYGIDDSSFLISCLMDLDYMDSLRYVVGAQPIITYSPDWRSQGKSKYSAPDCGSYLDRILVRGSDCLRSGCLAPGHTNLLSTQYTPDHALVLTDIAVDPLVSAPAAVSTLPHQPLRSAARKFLARARRMLLEAPDDPDQLATLVAPCFYSDAAMPDLAASITQVAQSLLLVPPSTREGHIAATDQLEWCVQSYIDQLYTPFILKANPAEGNTAPPVPLLQQPAVCTALHAIAQAASLVPGGNAPAEPSAVNEDAIAVAIRDAWSSLLHLLPEALRPEAEVDPRLGCSQCLASVPGPTKLASLARAKYLSTQALMHLHKQYGRLQREKAREHALASFANDKSSFFRETMGIAKPVSTMPDYTATYLSEDNPPVRKVSQCSADHLKGTEQHWSRLYGRDPWPGLPFIRTVVDPVTAYRSSMFNASFSPAPPTHPDIQATHAAFRAAERVCVDWVAVEAPITDSDFSHMFNDRWGRSAGMSGMKMCAVQFFPLEMRGCLQAVLQAMWSLRIFPPCLKVTAMVLLEKQDGGQRGISLIEEMLKALDSLLASRIKHCILPHCSLKDLLSDRNRAYKKNMSIADIIHAHAYIFEDAMLTGKPLVCAMTDLSKFFDTVQLPVVEAVLQLKGASSGAIDLARAMYHRSVIRIHSRCGTTRSIPRMRGLHQGSPLSCLLCLLFLEPYLRAVESLPLDGSYMICEGLSALDVMYSDDSTKYAEAIAALQARLYATDTVLAACGMGQDQKKALVVAANIASVELESSSVEIMSYDRETGARTSFSKPVHCISSAMGEYRLLGAFFKSHTVNSSRARTLVRNVRHVASRIASKGLPVEATAMLVQACVLGKVADSTVLMSPLGVADLSLIDTSINRTINASVHLPPAAPRSWFCATRGQSGLGLPSALSTFVQATLREVLISLNRESYEGTLARHSFTLLASCTDDRAANCLLSRALLLLDQFGIRVRSSAEMLFNRVFTLTAAALPSRPAGLTCRYDAPPVPSHVCSSLCTAATVLRGHVIATATALPHATAEDPLPSAEAIENATMVLQTALPSLSGEAVAELVSDVLAARAHAASDWLSTCLTLSATGSPNTPSEELSFSEAAHADCRINQLICPVLVTALASMSDEDLAACVTASDGSSFAAAVVVVRPRAPGAISTLGLYNQRIPPRPEDVLFSRRVDVPPRTGYLARSSYSTEMVGQLLDLRLRFSYPLGPSFVDNQSVLSRVCSRQLSNQRIRTAEGYPHLHHLLDAALRHLSSSVAARPPQPAASELLWSQLRTAWGPAAHTVLQAPRSHIAVKVKSHQRLPPAPDQPGLPCQLAVYANDIADRLVSSAAVTEAVSVDIPPARGRFFAMTGAAMITGKLSSYFWERTSSDAHAHWSDLRRRPLRGLAALAQPAVNKHACNFLAFPRGLSKDTSLGRIDSVSLLLRHNLRLGGSWSLHLQNNHVNPLNVSEYYERAFSELFQAEVDAGRQLPTKLHELCPFCLHSGGVLVRGGADHFRSLRCACVQIRALATTALVAVERHLTSLAPHGAWVANSSPLCPAPFPCAETPTLSALGWMLHSPLESVSSGTAALALTAEQVVWSLGWRAGTTPALLKYGARPLSAEEVQGLEWCKVLAIEDLCIALDARFTEAVEIMMAEEEHVVTAGQQPSSGVAAAPGIPVPTRCAIAGCMSVAHQTTTGRCNAHTESMRSAALTKLVQALVLKGPLSPLLPPPVGIKDFLHPQSTQSIISKKFVDIKLALIRKRLYVRHTQLSSPTTQYVFANTLFPHRVFDNSPGVWPGYTRPNLLCSCEGHPTTNRRRTLTTPVVCICSLCDGLRVVTPIIGSVLNPHFPCCLCLTALSLPPDGPCCSCCLYPKHSSADELALPPCSAPCCPPPPGSPWICPRCQLLITKAFCSRALDGATARRSLDMITIAPLARRLRATPPDG